jgi:epoxyqueuosine reductase QueG
MEKLKLEVLNRMAGKVSALGFAPVERFKDAPEGHHPADACRGARTVIVYGIPVPRGAITSPGYNLHCIHRSYHTIYRRLDEISIDLCNFLEARGGCQAVPAPSYAPMVFHGVEPWGVISLKHAAVLAGLGSFGRSGQVYHPRYGSLLRLAAVITSAAIPGDPAIEGSPCPPECTACRKACPVRALDADDGFRKLVCLGHAVKHAIYPLALKDETGLKNIERIINTAGHDYWIACDECLKVCPLNRPARQKTAAGS